MTTNCGVLHTYSAQRGGTQPPEKSGKLSDFECSEHRHGARPRSPQCVVLYRRSPCLPRSRPLACPAAESARKKPRLPENSTPKKKCMRYTDIRVPSRIYTRGLRGCRHLPLPMLRVGYNPCEICLSRHVLIYVCTMAGSSIYQKRVLYLVSVSHARVAVG